MSEADLNLSSKGVLDMGSAQLQIVTGTEFARASAKLPKDIRAKLSKATSSLFNGSSMLGAHLEKIKAADDDIYSLRVDDCYRIILKYPSKGNVAFLLYVDRHDEAYEWARRHSVAINSVTGGIQTAIMLTPTIVRENGLPKPNAKLAVLTDKDFVTMGIPMQYWEQLRTQIFSPNQLIGFKKYLAVFLIICYERQYVFKFKYGLLRRIQYLRHKFYHDIFADFPDCCYRMGLF